MPTAPKFLEHHVPTPGWALVPDCLCTECSAVRKAWGEQREVDPPCSECGSLSVPGFPCPLCRVRKWNAEHVAPETLWEREEEPEFVQRELACPTCRRAFCRVLVRPGTPITVLCPGCQREGR